MRRHFSLVAVLGVLAILGSAGQAGAALYTYDATAGATFSWDNDASWVEAGRPNAAGDVANVATNASLIANFASDITIGAINYKPTAERRLQLVGAANKITFDSGVSGQAATFYADRGASTLYNIDINASEINLKSDLVIARSSTAAMLATRSSTITGKITGDGSLTIWVNNDNQTQQNARYLNFNGTQDSTYTGGTTIIAAGTNLSRPTQLLTNHNNAFGSGILSLSGNILWGMSNSHTVQDFSFNGVNIGEAGTFTSSDLNTRYGTTAFSGAGTLTTVIPEPATAGMLLLGLSGLFLRRRAKAQA